jgi:hypothetical protein
MCPPRRFDSQNNYGALEERCVGPGRVRQGKIYRGMITFTP